MDLHPLSPNPGSNPPRPAALPTGEPAADGVGSTNRREDEFVPKALELDAPTLKSRDVLERSAELRAQLAELQREYSTERELDAERIRELRDSLSLDREQRHEALMQTARAILQSGLDRPETGPTAETPAR